MTLVLDATLGGSQSNAYVTASQAQAYYDSRFGVDAWSNASSQDQIKALVQATRNIDRFRFIGRRNAPTQALKFPRAYPWHLRNYDQFVDLAVAIPEDVANACCEEALSILQNVAMGGVGDRQILQSEGVKSYQVGNLTETFAAGAVNPADPPICPTAKALLNKWISRTARLTSIREPEGRLTAARELYGRFSINEPSPAVADGGSPWD